LTAATGNYL